MTPRRLPVPRAVIVIVAAAVLAAVVAAVVLVALDDGPDPAPAATLDRPRDVAAYLAATGPAVVTVSSLDYRDLPDDLTAGLAVTGGGYRSAYRAALTGAAARATVRGQVVQTFDLLQAGVGQISDGGTQARVLVFGVRHVSGTGGSSDAPITLTATVRRTGGRFLITALDEDANAGLPPGSAGLRQAAEAARREIDALLSYRRAHLATDIARALDGATGALRTQLRARSAGLRAALVRGRYDLSGAVTAVAVHAVTPGTVTVLVAATGERVAASGTRTVVTDGRYVVETARVGPRWLATQIRSLGAQS